MPRQARLDAPGILQHVIGWVCFSVSNFKEFREKESLMVIPRTEKNYSIYSTPSPNYEHECAHDRGAQLLHVGKNAGIHVERDKMHG